MTLSRCPKCNDDVRIPARVSPQATLKCPLCGESFEAAVVLDSLPPELEIVHDPAPPTLPAVPSHSDSTGFQGIEVSVGSAHDHIGEQVPAFEFDESEAPQRDAPTFTQEETPPPTRRRRKQRSPIPQVLGVVLGGLASIPLAQLCLWWIFGTDPIDMGPSVSQYVPFVVPAKFRDVAQLEDDTSNGQSTSQDDPQSGSRSRQAIGKRTLLSPDDPDPFKTGDAPPKSTDESVPSAPDTDKQGQQPNQNQQLDASSPGKFPANATTTENKAPSEAGGAGVLGVEFEPTDPDPTYANLADPTAALLRQQVTTPDEIYESMQTALDGYDVWNNKSASSGADRSQQLDAFYESLCELGKRLLYIDPSDAPTMLAAHTVQASFAEAFQQPTMRQFLANRAARQLEKTLDQDSEGLALAGTVTEIKRAGDLLVTTVRLNDTSRSLVQVYGWRVPPKEFQVGSSVVFLGARVADPQAVLPLPTEVPEVIAGAYLFVSPNDDK